MKTKPSIKNDNRKEPLLWFTEQKFLIWMFLLATAVIIPWPIPKFFSYCAIALYFYISFNTTKKENIFSLLIIVFGFAYLLSPYWIIPASSEKNHIGILPAKIITATILSGLGILWSWLASDKIGIISENKKKVYLPEAAILAILLAAINYFAINACIPIGGDEEWHIWRWQVLRNIIKPVFCSNFFITSLVTITIVTVLVWIRKIPLYIKILAILFTILVSYFLTDFFYVPKIDYLLLRYPFISCWLHQIGPVFEKNQFEEGMYRLIPLFSSFIIVWFILITLKKNNVTSLMAIATSIMFALTPNLYYHSTLLYLELPALALLTISLYHIKDLLTLDFLQIRKTTGWYTLILAGFFKETLMIIIFSIIVLRGCIRLYLLIKEKKIKITSISQELAIAFCIAMPISIYLFFRMYFGDIRSFTPHLSNLTNLKLYLVAAKSMWLQFAPLIFLAIVGIIINFKNGKKLETFSLLFISVTHFLFYYIDKPEYVGLARFYLFLFAPLTVFSLIAITNFIKINQKLAVIVIILCISTNIYLSPVSLSGSKDSKFAFPLAKLGDCQFQHKDAMQWLKDNRNGWPVLIGGHYSKFNPNWYFAKLNHKTKTAEIKLDPATPYMEGLSKTLITARKAGVPLVLFHKMKEGKEITESEKCIEGFNLIKTFSNKYWTLVLYQIENH